ncbi:uncharacterized protein H6S33_013108 [Morchella sextelata]|uniref:uncharacterized protein n=1 Tax=Morchella sextelata TaxID=1174677 RepID=UPI001D047567|nr:uncharacterized protein H6S33_013108 [Morchella sextelata]KAH0609622.1 hypothetical protein H6S33_013108 [Morchella sextelata]
MLAPTPLRFLLRRRPYSTTTTTAPPLITSTSIPAPHTGTIKLLKLNRPKAKNAISRALLAELAEHVNAIGSGADRDTRVLIIGSAVEGVFCAGADLKERAGFTKADTDAFLTSLRSTLTNLSTLPIPTISAISSVALGGGLELALATDLRVVSEGAQIGLPETRLAIVPGAGGCYRLPALVGRSRALDLILTGRRVGAAEALGMGLVNRVVEGDAVEGAVEVAMEVCRGGPVAVRAAVEAVGRGRGGEEGEGWAYERVVGTWDRNEALRAFREKRKPEFKGE